MSPPTLISDIFDLIVDHLHDQPKTLRACCLVSKEWVTRARQHLFACVIFYLDRQIKSWMAAYPDISNSPACYVRTLFVFDNVSIIAACESPPTWLHQFCRVKSFGMGDLGLIAHPILVSFVQLHGFSPTLTHLHIFFLSTPLSEIVNLICSFPLLEVLILQGVTTQGDADERGTPSTSPRLTGSLHVLDLTPSVIRGLLGFPNGLHFAKIVASCPVESTKSVVDLISSCSDTLESLTVGFNSLSLFSFASVVSKYLTPAVAPRPLVLSEVVKLKDVELKCIGLNVQWITTTLRTAKPTNLRKITISITSPDRLVNPVGEMVRREWRDVDYLLDQLWASDSVLPEIMYEESETANGLGESVRSLLPELASKGVVNPCTK